MTLQEKIMEVLKKKSYSIMTRGNESIIDVVNENDFNDLSSAIEAVVKEHLGLPEELGELYHSKMIEKSRVREMLDELKIESTSSYTWNKFYEKINKFQSEISEKESMQDER